MLTKENVLKCTTEEQILKAFVPDFQKIKVNCKSPFTDKDEKPSFSTYLEGNVLKFKSHNTSHQGDVFQLVADLHNLDSKKDFTKVLQIIADKTNIQLEQKKAVNIEDFSITYQSFTVDFLAFWNQFKVSQETLLRYKVKQIDQLKYKKDSKQLNFKYRENNILAVCYEVNKHIKTYIPALPQAFNNNLNIREQKKMFGYKNQTNKDVFGLEQLPPPPIPYVIFSAGEKDCLVLNQHGFSAISMQSENQLPNKELITFLQDKADYLYSCYDNDEAGKAAAVKLKNTFGIEPIVLPEGFKDVADYFKKYGKSEFQKLLNEAENKKREELEDLQGTSIFHVVESYLNTKYKFRYNAIKCIFEYTENKKYNYKELNENNLYVEIRKQGIKIGMNDLKALLKSDFCKEYNPIEYYFQNLNKWNEDQPDYINQLANHVTAEHQEDFNTHIKKWFVRAVRCALDKEYYNRNALILVHNQQNSGKSTFLRYFCPPALSEYIIENIDPNNKDSLIALATNFIINLDELKQLSKQDVNVIKSWISQKSVNVRMPYESRSKVYPRVCSFVGSTNESSFLHDETGSSRYLCFKINDINHDYNNINTNIQNVNIDDVWSQAYALYKSGFKADLTNEELEKNEDRNAEFKQLSAEIELIPTMCEQSISQDDFMTATEILTYMSSWTTGVKLNSIQLGKALAYHGFVKYKHSKRQLYGYNIKKLKGNPFLNTGNEVIPPIEKVPY